MAKMDIRIMKLNKWYVPKSFELAEFAELDLPIVLGYFDALEVTELKKEIDLQVMHPFTAGYQELVTLKSEKKKELVDFSSQEQMLFLDICEDNNAEGGFTEAEVREFWNDQGKKGPYLFLSMIHISHSGNLKKALDKIRKVFSKDYLSYISFDYCDIVLFAQNMQISDYLEKIRKLFEEEPKSEMVIFDTFSVVSFYTPNDFKQKSFTEEKPFQATINLSIRDHKAFNEWFDKEIKSPSVIRYDLFGRHDVSITKESADTQWLMQIMDKLHDKNNQKMFWTFETFIKIKHDSRIREESDIAGHLEETHQKVKRVLQDEIDNLIKMLTSVELSDPNRYVLPLYEVRDCICSIVKNSFAEEFVCCIYEPFLHFVSYIREEIGRLSNGSQKYNIWEEELAECYDKFFVALNTLVNSTMHNERQFIQATAFNAVFYSVPPKIMAFYNAYIYRVKQVLMDEINKNQYSFLIYPSFSPNIFVEQVSLNDPPPCDRILTVTISEKSLYNIKSVMCQMVHELAHYIGSDLRCRKVRTQKINLTLLRWIMVQCGMESEEIRTIQLFWERSMEREKDKKNLNQYTESDQYDYLQYLSLKGKKLLTNLNNIHVFRDFYMEYCQELIGMEDFYDEFLEDMGIKKEYQRAYIENYTRQYVDIKCKNIHRHILKMSGIHQRNNYRSYIDLIKCIYRESYADLQMILVLAMDADNYLNSFLVHQEIPVQYMLNQPQDIIRISTVFRVMVDSRLWKEPAEQNNESLRPIYEFINKYNHQAMIASGNEKSDKLLQKAECISQIAAEYDFCSGIQLNEKLTSQQTESINEECQKARIRPFGEMEYYLYEYLLDVMHKSLEEYSKEDKLSKIRQVRELVNKMLYSQNAAEIFKCVEAEMNYYKKEGCKI